MKYRRVLLVTELGADARAEVATIRRVAPEADLLVVIARLPARKFAWFSGEAPGDLNEAATGVARRAAQRDRGRRADGGDEARARARPWTISPRSRPRRRSTFSRPGDCR